MTCLERGADAVKKKSPKGTRAYSKLAESTESKGGTETGEGRKQLEITSTESHVT